MKNFFFLTVILLLASTYSMHQLKAMEAAPRADKENIVPHQVVTIVRSMVENKQTEVHSPLPSPIKYASPKTVVDYAVSKERKRLYAKLETEYGIKSPDVRAKQAEIQAHMKEHGTPQTPSTPKAKRPEVSERMKKRARCLLAELNLEAAQLKIKPGAHDDGPASASYNGLAINEEKLKKYKKRKAQEQVVLHEGIHLKNGDLAEENAVRFLVQEKLDARGQEEPDDNTLELVAQLSRLQEGRADLKAAAHKKRFAQGYVLAVKRDLQEFGEGSISPTASHPRLSLRLEAAKTLVKLHHQSDDKKRKVPAT